MKVNFEVFRGDTFEKTLFFTDSEGNNLDITNWTITFTVKRPEYIVGDDNDTDALIQVRNVVSNGLAGKTTIKCVIDIDPGNYVYDVQIVKSNDEVRTILFGDFIVKADVTREV